MESESSTQPNSSLLTEEEAAALTAVAEQFYQEAQQRKLEQSLERGYEQGLEQGMAPLRHQCRRRLGRALTEYERAELRRRLFSLGPERLGAVVLDSSGDELARWLADPDAG